MNTADGFKVGWRTTGCCKSRWCCKYLEEMSLAQAEPQIKQPKVNQLQLNLLSGRSRENNNSVK